MIIKKKDFRTEKTQGVPTQKKEKQFVEGVNIYIKVNTEIDRDVALKQALSKLKNKTRDYKIVAKAFEKKFYTKPSMKKRIEKQKAIRLNEYRKTENNTI